MRQRHQPVVIGLIEVIAVDVDGEDIKIFITGIILCKLAIGTRRSIDAPHPDQVVEFVMVDKPVEQLSVQGGGGVLSFIATTPPEPVAIHFMVGTPQYG